jgi:hypothetical protein
MPETKTLQQREKELRSLLYDQVRNLCEQLRLDEAHRLAATIRSGIIRDIAFILITRSRPIT